MSEMGFENVFYLENFECAGDEVLVESSPPASPDMAARLAAPAQSNGAGNSSPSTVRELIVIPELPSIHLQHATIQQTVVEVNGDSSGQSSPNQEGQHTFITVATDGVSWTPIKKEVADASDNESEGGNGVNYHVQYVTEPQEIYAQGHQNMETLRSYPVYGVATVNGAAAEPAPADNWGGASSAEYTAYGVVVAGDEAEAPASPATPGAAVRMPPATVQWLLEHYETAEGVSLPRSTLYAHYLRHCAAHRLEPVNAASFGKLIRSVFVGLRTRRLGTRGNSKYHYYGIRAKPGAPPPPDEPEPEPERDERRSPEHRQYLGSPAPPSPPPAPATPDGAALARAHRAHAAQLLAAVGALDAAAVTAAAGWWRRAPAAALARPTAAPWLRAASARLYQAALELLLPDVLRPIPPHLTQAIRNFAKAVEGAVAAGSAGAPAPLRRAQGAAATALAHALRRYTSLNHLAQAARAVLSNAHQIHQMVADLSRVDFRVVREQAAWACACGGARRLEAEFKAELGRGASLEQWAGWLQRCVLRALAPHARRPRLVARARRLLLDWSFYSSLVIRELTLRSAASFGSFHLIRLLYDEYVAYLIERRVAEHLNLPPIAVMHRLTEDTEDENEENVPPEGEGEGEGEAEVEAEAEVDEENDQEWEWEDDEEDDEQPEVKRVKLNDE